MKLPLFPIPSGTTTKKAPFIERIRPLIEKFKGKTPKIKTYFGAPQRALGELLAEIGIGACVSPTTKKHFDSYLFYFLDNGAFKYWLKGEPFKERPFFNLIEKSLKSGKRADFLVLPDLIGRGKESLEFSASYAEKLKGIEIPFALALQDGMEGGEVRDFVSCYCVEVLFVGGDYPLEVGDSPQVGKACRRAGDKVPHWKGSFRKEDLSSKKNWSSLNRFNRSSLGREEVYRLHRGRYEGFFLLTNSAVRGGTMLTRAIAELGVVYLRLLEQKGKIEIRRENGKITIKRKDEGRNLCKVFNAKAGQEKY